MSNRITVQDVRDMVARIKEQAENGDTERAHAREDELHLAVLRAVADHHPASAALAREALAADLIEFTRWCA